MTSTGTVNMTQGSVQKVIIKFAFPVFLSQLFQQFYNIIDSLIVGNFIDKDALAAVFDIISPVVVLEQIRRRKRKLFAGADAHVHSADAHIRRVDEPFVEKLRVFAHK